MSSPGREQTRHGHRCERLGGESWCSCEQRQQEASGRRQTPCDKRCDVHGCDETMTCRADPSMSAGRDQSSGRGLACGCTGACPHSDYPTSSGRRQTHPYDADVVEMLCARAHVAYESAALAAGWETQERSRVPWESLPEANKEAMRAAIVAVLDGLVPTAVHARTTEPKRFVYDPSCPRCASGEHLTDAASDLLVDVPDDAQPYSTGWTTDSARTPR